MFPVRDLRLYFPALEPWVVRSVSLPSCFSRFIRTQMWDHLLRQPPPCHRSSLPSCPSSPLLQVWMNVSSLTPWLLDSHTVRLSGRSGDFLFFNLLLSFFWLCKEAKCVSLCLHLGGKSILLFIAYLDTVTAGSPISGPSPQREERILCRCFRSICESH